MSWAGECAVVIPCLNEAPMIGHVVTAVRRHLPAVFVIDDGSVDDTAVKAGQAGAEVLRHAVCRGKGAALQTGWQHARGRGFKWVLTMDGDGQHSPEDVPLFLARAKTASAPLIIGNRMQVPGQMPRLRVFVNRWMSERISRSVGRQLPDTQCGFRLIQLEALSIVRLATSHFQIESEVVLEFARAGLKIEFVPIQVIYGTERSKIRPVTDTLRWFRWWWRDLQKAKKAGVAPATHVRT